MANPLGTKRFEDPQPAGLWLVGGLVLFALVLLLAHSRLQPPAPRPQDAPLAEFSGGRARQVHQMLVGDGRPHPTGSRRGTRWSATGCASASCAGWGISRRCSPTWSPCRSAAPGWRTYWPACRGARAGRAVLLMAHYDSRPGAGFGASDDMAGVAADPWRPRGRSKAGPAPRHLSADPDRRRRGGAGLFGAQAFAEASRRPNEVGVVVNSSRRAGRRGRA